MTDTTTPPDRTTHAKFEAAYYDYVRELEKVSHELTQGVMSAQNAVRTGQLTAPDPTVDPRETLEAMSRDYGAAIHSAWEASQRRYGDAYFGFLESFGRAWADADRSHMSPPALAAIANSVVAVANHASATIGNTDVFAWTGVPMPDPAGAKREAISEGGSPK